MSSVDVDRRHLGLLEGSTADLTASFQSVTTGGTDRRTRDERRA
jgi:hypothetical protein